MKRTRGFTLVEVLIAAAIIGVLLAIALPSYQNYKIRSNRTDMKQMMQSIGQQMQVYKTANNYSYTNATFASTTSTLLINSSTSVVSQYPISDPKYQLTLVVTDVNGVAPPVAAGVSWRLTAIPMGTQSLDGSLVLNDQGWTCWNKTNGTAMNLCVNSAPTFATTWDGN